MTTAPPPAPLPRRRLLGRALLLPLSPVLALAGCASPWPEVPAGPGSSSARVRLRESADAHGLAAWRRLQDVSLGFSGFWSPVSGAMPAGGAAVQARWLPHGGPPVLAAAAADGAATALLADLHRLLWLGPMAVAGSTAAVNWAEPETLQDRRCDHLHLALSPGPGGAAADRLSLFIDRDQALLRRLRVSLSVLGGAVLAEVDLAEHRRLFGVSWPTRFQARAPRPGGWQLSGLDVDRGYRADDLAGAAWRGAAAAPARPLPPA